jgi:hypothetical protein
MHCFLLQDYVTLSGASNLPITQSADAWLDLSGFQDIVVYLEVKEFSLGGATNVLIAYQTGPTPEEALFATMTSLNLALGVTVTILNKDTAAIPLARWLRFQMGPDIAGGSAWDATFRVWVAANARGPDPARSLAPGARAALNGGEMSVPSIPLHAEPANVSVSIGLPILGPRLTGITAAGPRTDASGRPVP